MSEGRSKELDDVRKLLFPNLDAEDGWAKIDAAVEGAADDERFAAIEELANRDLTQDLYAALERLRRASGS